MSYYAALQRLSLQDADPAHSSEAPAANGASAEPTTDGAAAVEPASETPMTSNPPSRSYASAVGTAAAAASDAPDDCTTPAPSAAPSSLPGGAAAAAAAPRACMVQNALIWMDLEMTGLDPRRDSIIEIAVIITNSHLENELPGPELAIHHSDEVLDGMNAWSAEHHGASGLTARCRASNVSMQEAEERVLDFVQRYTDDTTRHHLAGSSVHVDLAFLRKDMPRLAAHLPYRVVDVSTVMELCRRWYPAEYNRAPRKRNAHTALSDIQDSIRQLRHYRKSIFKPPELQASDEGQQKQQQQRQQKQRQMQHGRRR